MTAPDIFWPPPVPGDMRWPGMWNFGRAPGRLPDDIACMFPASRQLAAAGERADSAG